LTSDSQSAIINLSNEREDKPFENTWKIISIRHRNL
jgi:hypothetical protein